MTRAITETKHCNCLKSISFEKLSILLFAWFAAADQVERSPEYIKQAMNPDLSFGDRSRPRAADRGEAGRQRSSDRRAGPQK